MADWSNDIEKYRKGELSPSQMHALEKKALSDPFLAEALEGSDEISAEDFSNDVSELTTRITTTRKKELWTPLRIAAGILLIVGVSSIMYFLSNNTSVEELADQIQPDAASSSPKMDEQKDSVSKPDENLLSLNETQKKEEQDITALKQQPTAALKSSEPKDNDKKPVSGQLLLAEEKSDDAELKKEEEIAPAPVVKEEVKIADAQATRSLQEESISEKKKSIASDRELSRAKKLAAPSVSGASSSQNNQFVAGQVTSAEDGSPLPGVNVVIKGTTEGAITDVDGNYSIPLTNQQNTQLVFSFIGLESTEVDVKDQAPLNVQMNADVQQLSEVVVTGYGVVSGDMGEPSSHSYSLAEPAGGKRAYRKYLETNLRYPTQAKEKKIEGRVTIEFTVKTTGAVTDFRVVKGIGSGCDEEVMRLVQDGPKWTPSKQDDKVVDSQMRVNLRFKLPGK